MDMYFRWKKQDVGSCMGKRTGKRFVGRPRREWEKYVSLDLRGMSVEGQKWNKLAHGLSQCSQCLTFISTEMLSPATRVKLFVYFPSLTCHLNYVKQATNPAGLHKCEFLTDVRLHASFNK
jgi:hypothetical protein